MTSKKRSAGGRPLRRKVATKRIRKTLLVFCEGVRTEPEYLNSLKLEPAVREVAAVEIRMAPANSGMVPLALVKRAMEARSKAAIENDEIDEFWCVFDVEWPRQPPQLVRSHRLGSS